jgi:hypothetical protein
MVEIIVHCTQNSNIFSSGHASGGYTALNNLVQLINKSNYKNITARISNKAYDIPDKENTLIVHGEAEIGNEYNAIHVLHWICLDLHFYPKSILNSWNYKDLVCHWESSNKNAFLLNVLSINPLYKHVHLERKGTCHIYKKRLHSKEPVVHVHDEDSICLDDMPTLDLVKVLNSVEICYSYDEYTWINLGAILCKCKLVIVPYFYKTKDEFIKNKSFEFPKFPQMFAWGKDDLQTIHYNDDDIDELKQYVENKSDVHRFLKNIDDYFNNKPCDIPTVFDILHDTYTPFIAVDENIIDDLYFIDSRLDLHTANLHETGNDLIFHRGGKSFYINKNRIHILKDCLSTIDTDDISEFVGYIFDQQGYRHIICKNQSVQNAWGTFVDVVRKNGKWLYDGKEFIPNFYKHHPNPPDGDSSFPKRHKFIISSKV